MRKIRIFEHISLDGVIEHGDDSAHGEWTAPYRSPAGREAVAEAQGSSFDLLLGRRTYDHLGQLLAEGREQSDGGCSERRNEIRRDPQTGEPRMGASQGLGRGHLESVRGLKATDGPT